MTARASSAAALALAAALVAGADSAEKAPARGGLIAFERTVAGNMDIYVVPVAGGPERRLTHDPADDALPRWAPGGRSLVFSSKRTGEWQIYEMSVQGGAPRRLRQSPYREWQADLSPDGRFLAYLSNASGREALWVEDRVSGRARKLVEHGESTILGNPNWSPLGRFIVFSSNYGLPGHRVYVADIASGTEERVSPATSGGCEPRFARDGQRVAYVRRQHLTRSRSRIVEVDLRSGEERRLVDWPALNYDPAYSPDGTETAFASTIAGEFAIYRQRLRDGKSWRVTFGPGVARHPDYQP